MAKANVFNMAGQQVGEIELSEAVFGIEPNQAVVHEARRAPATPVRVPPGLPSGLTAVSCLLPSPAITATPSIRR